MQKRVFILCTLVLAFLLIGPGSARAPHEPKCTTCINACDNSVQEAIKSASWVMGKRELEMAQTIILKETSQVELGCYKWRFKEVVAWVPTVFVTDVLGIVIPYDYWMQQQVIDNWGAGNFGENYGGGFYPMDGAYWCNNMNKLWRIAQCQDFNKNYFMTLNELAGNDPRIWPTTCEGIEEDEDTSQSRSDKWYLNLVKSQRYMNIPPGPGQSHGIITYLPMQDPTRCSSDVIAVPTGLTVTINGQSYPDAVCPAAACYYNPVSGRCR